MQKGELAVTSLVLVAFGLVFSGLALVAFMGTMESLLGVGSGDAGGGSDLFGLASTVDRVCNEEVDETVYRLELEEGHHIEADGRNLNLREDDETIQDADVDCVAQADTEIDQSGRYTVGYDEGGVVIS